MKEASNPKNFGITGFFGTVAFSTVLARIVEFACCIIHSIKSNIKFRLPLHDMVQRNLIKDF